MTSEGLGEVSKGDSADTCGGKCPLVSMGVRANRQACADGERGPPSARAEITIYILQFWRMSWLMAPPFLENSKMEFSRHPGFCRSQGMSISVEMSQV